MKNVIWLVLAIFMFAVIGCADDDASTLPTKNTPSAADVGINDRAPAPRPVFDREFGLTAFDGDSDILDTDLWATINADGQSFTMGNDNAYTAEAPAHTVTFTGNFEIMKWEITTTLYHQCVLAGECTAPPFDVINTYEDTDTNDTDSGPGTVIIDTDADPWCITDNYNLDYNGGLHSGMGAMTCMTHAMASDYCAWISGRLPTEAEWEYVARSMGGDYNYPWEWDTADVDSDTWADCDHAMMMSSLTAETAISGCGWGWVADAPCGDQAPMGTATNFTEQGVCDMAGNAAEWVADMYHPTYDNAPTDGSAWMNVDSDPAILDSARVIRGGHYRNFAGWVRTTSRSYNHQSVGHSGRSYGAIGARCVRDL